MGYRVRPTPTNAATLKNSAFVTLTLRTSPEDCRTNSFGVVVAAAAEDPDPDGPGAPGPEVASATITLQFARPFGRCAQRTTRGGGTWKVWTLRRILLRPVRRARPRSRDRRSRTGTGPALA